MSFRVGKRSRFRAFMRTAVSNSWEGDPTPYMSSLTYNDVVNYSTSITTSTQFISTYQYVKLHLLYYHLQSCVESLSPQISCFRHHFQLEKQWRFAKWMQQSWSVIQEFNCSWKKRRERCKQNQISLNIQSKMFCLTRFSKFSKVVCTLNFLFHLKKKTR